MNYGNKTVLVWAYSTWIHVAITLSKTFGRTILYTAPEYSEDPNSERARIGEGIKGVEILSPMIEGPLKGKSFWDVVPSVDLFCFVGVGHADVQDELKRQGKRVWGSGKAGDLEIFRGKAKEQMEQYGLPVQEWETIKGLSALEDYLSETKEVRFVKIPGLRGDGETFKFDGDLRTIEHRFDKLRFKKGRIACENMTFQVEHEIKRAIEGGTDQHFVGGECSPEVLVGLEKKDQVYVATHMPLNMLAEPLRKPLDVMSEILDGKDIAMWNSTEIRIPESDPKKGFVLEWTQRMGAPPGELIMKMIDNIPDILWYGAEGIMVPPKYNCEVGMMAIIDTDMGESQSKTIVLDKGAEEYVDLRHYCVEGDAYSILPQHGGPTAIGAVVATGKDIISTAKLLSKRCDHVHGDGLLIFVDAIPKAIADLRKGEEMKIDFGSVLLPTAEEVEKAINEQA